MEEKRIEKVEIASADPSPTIVWVFTMLCVMFWAQFLGYTSPQVTLFVGLIQLGCWPVYLIGSTQVIKNGDGINGNCFMIFACVFGGIGGLTNVFAFLASQFGWAVDNTILGYTWVWAALAMVAILIAIRNAPFMYLFTYASGTLELAIAGLSTLGILKGAYWGTIAGWLCLCMALGGLYSMFGSFLAMGGINLPIGKPLFAPAAPAAPAAPSAVEEQGV